MLPEKFLKPYNPKETEDRIYKKWEKSGYFNPDNLPEPRGEPFSIVLPPPNVTGVLHIGHAYEDTLQDIVVRFQRMRGKKTLWVPGADSAAIATQARVEKNIQKEEGRNRHDLGRAELVRRVEQFAKESEHTILEQVRRMGSSLDWSRYAFTLDEKRYRAVREAFVRMFNAGLIYRGHRIVNWDPKGQTTISDDEIAYIEEQTALYYLKYGPFTIATARPETKFGDKYVVVHPDDERYAEFKDGDTLELEWINGPVTATIIKDGAVDPEFGTGAMTITPWHDSIDFDIAARRELDKEQIIDEHGRLLPVAGEFAGLKIAEARPKIVEKLREKGLLVKEENYAHHIATSDRTGGIIEPQIKLQWFVDVNKEFALPHSEIPGIPSGSQTSLKALMRVCVQSGAIDMPQEGFRKTYFHWIDNLRDWCISRQIWFGHRIPVWYRGSEEAYCGTEAPEGEEWVQDEDVLDTWFSSALWTFSTLGWPENTSDLETYHPTSFMSPAYEILPLWVSRMILMSAFHLGQVPFETVFIHGLVRAKDGRKFSKSAGNGVDPLDLIEKYGADALRMGLIAGAPLGSDVKFDEQRVRGYKLFANKVWNISRFIFESCGDEPLSAVSEAVDRALMQEFEALAQGVTDDLETFRLHLAAEKIYHFLWHRLADEILEESKPILRGEGGTAKKSRQAALMGIFLGSLRLLHPFMPFITEEIWSFVPVRDRAALLMIEPWPAFVVENSSSGGKEELQSS